LFDKVVHEHKRYKLTGNAISFMLQRNN
jgi:hypothetical protein